MKLIYSVAAVLALATVGNAAAGNDNSDAPVVGKNNKAERKSAQAEKASLNEKKRKEAQERRAAARKAENEREQKRKALERRKAAAAANAAKRAAAKAEAERLAEERRKANEAAALARKRKEKEEKERKVREERERREREAREKRERQEREKRERQEREEREKKERENKDKKDDDDKAARKAAEEKAAREKAAKEKEAARKAAEEKAAAEKAAAEKEAARKAAEEKAAAEKAAAEKEAAEYAKLEGKGVVFQGYLYLTLDAIDKSITLGETHKLPDVGKCFDDKWYPLRAGWEAVEEFDEGIRRYVVGAYPWGTMVITSKSQLINVGGWQKPGFLNQGGNWWMEQTVNGQKQYKVPKNKCNAKILMRKKVAPKKKTAEEIKAEAIKNAADGAIYDGYLYMTLDQVPADASRHDVLYGQYKDLKATTCFHDKWYPLPAGWEAVEQFDAGIISNVIAKHSWSTMVITSKSQIINVLGHQQPGRLNQGGNWWMEQTVDGQKQYKVPVNKCHAKILMRRKL